MLNLSKDAYINKSKTVTGSLIFNGTSYAGTSWDDDNSTGVYVLLTIPQTSNTTTTDFYFTYNINDQSYNTSLYRVTVLLMPPIAVNATDCNGLTPAMNFIMRDEENLTNLTGTIDYVFQFGLTNGSYKNISGSLTTGIMKLCINSTLYPTWTLGTGEIHYTSPGYVSRRYYVFSNTRITNITINITLFNLLSSSQTSFDLVVESTSLIPYSNKYTSLIRWYPSTNNYDVVDMGKTDETGSTVIHVKTEDVDYRIGVYELNGSLIKLANPIRMVCLTSPCTYTMRIGDDNIDYAELLRIEATLDFNETTNIWTLVYNDPSQKTSEMNLTVYKDTGSSSYVVCNNHLNAYTGAIRCNTTGYDGTLRAVVTRSASPGVPVLVKIVSLITSNFKSNWGLFLTFLIMIPIIMIFAIISPIAGIIGAVVSLIPAFYFGSISLAIISGVAILAGITLHFLNRSGGTR
jgi:hypothetical protein